MTNTPVLLIAFNRPNLLEGSLSSLVKLGVRNIWVHIDAPRPFVRQDETLVLQCAEIVESYRSHFNSLNIRLSKQNLGCKFGPISAINWFFTEADFGIILEDDVRVSPEFISYAEHGLAAYKNSKHIWMLNGWSPFNNGELTIDVWLSRYPVPWGWATWRDRWSQNRFSEHYSANAVLSQFKSILNSKISQEFETYWHTAFEAVASGFDAWDYEWFHEMWLQGGYAVTPPSRLTANVGFNAQSTHTECPVGRAAFPISVSVGYCPQESPKINPDLDLALDKLMFGMDYPASEFQFLSSIISESHSKTIRNLLIPNLNLTRVARNCYKAISRIPGLANFMKHCLRISSRIPAIAKLQQRYKSDAWFL